VLYRLATSPGRRALLGMVARRGRLVRPLLGATRTETREHCAAAGLHWREDPSNADPRFARARIRHEALPALGPRAERAIAETAQLLRDEAEVLDAAVAAAMTDDLAELAALPPALARLVLRELAGQPISRARADEVLALAGHGGTTYADVGGGLRAVAEYGRVRFTRAREEAVPETVQLPIPGRVRFGSWELTAGGDGEVALATAALGSALTVRAWRPGDRMRPLGLGGTKKLQDLFTDRKIPRERRAAVPVLEASGEIAWIPGVAVGERFAAREGEPATALAATLARP
jgi:tRNA(Ile)-lysidine synthase